MSGATQRCPECGSPLRPCRCGEDPGVRARNSTLRTRTRLARRRFLRASSFSDKYSGDGARYGPVFRLIREMRCWLWLEGYAGPGHEACGPGVQGGHTAHHVGRRDEDGLIPGCGAAHDLYAGLGGTRRVATFRAWLDSLDLTLAKVGELYVAKAREVLP